MKQQILWFSYQLWRLLNSLSQSVLEDVSPHLCDMCILWSPLVDLSKVIAWRSQKKNTSFRDAPHSISCGRVHPWSKASVSPAVLSKWVRLLTYMLSQATSSWHTCSHRLHAGLDTDALPQQCHLLLFFQAWYYAPLLSTHCCCTELRKERNEVLGWRSQ